MNSFCAGHLNDFRHLALGLGGLEEDYDLGFKLEEKESDEFRADANTGVEAFAEPLLVLYISVRDRESPKSLPTLQYGLTRSKFARGLTSNPEDRERLLQKARPCIRADVAALKAGVTPETARERMSDSPWKVATLQSEPLGSE